MCVALLRRRPRRGLPRRGEPAVRGRQAARRPRAARAARRRARRGGDRARLGAGRHRRAAHDGVEAAHGPGLRHAEQHARPAHDDLLRARPLLGGGVRHPRHDAVGRRRRGRVRDGADALPHGDAGRPARPRLRAPDARRPRLGGHGAVAARPRAVGVDRRARHGPAAARPRPAVGRRARRPRHAGRGRARVRRLLGDRLDLVRARQRRRGAAGAGWVAAAAARCARACAPRRRRR